MWIPWFEHGFSCLKIASNSCVHSYLCKNRFVVSVLFVMTGLGFCVAGSLFFTGYTWAGSWQNQQNGMCTQRRLWSDWASGHSFCWFCYEAAHMFLPLELQGFMGFRKRNEAPPENIPDLAWDPSTSLHRTVTNGYGKINFINVEHIGGKKPAKVMWFER